MPIDTSLEFVPINIAVITISDSRTKENDTSGDTLEKRIIDAGHQMIKRTIIPDDVSKIKDTLNTMSKEKKNRLYHNNWWYRFDRKRYHSRSCERNCK